MTAQARSILTTLPADIARAMVVLAVVCLLRACWRNVRERRRHLGGKWYQTSPDPRGMQDVLRVDRVRVHVFRSWIWGQAVRLEPPDEQPKRWRFFGRVSGGHISGSFYTIDLNSNPRSHGTFHLQMIDPFVWVGEYTTAVGGIDHGNPSSVVQELRHFPLEWAREVGAPRRIMTSPHS
jgi:hypothetical protein